MQMLAGSADDIKGEKRTLVQGLQSILKDLDTMKIHVAGAHAAAAHHTAGASAQHASTEAATQQEDLLRLAAATQGTHALHSSALLKRLQQQLFASLPLATVAHDRQAGAAAEAAHLRELEVHITTPHHHAGASPTAPAPAAVVGATGTAVVSSGAARARAAEVAQRQENVKMKAIDRLYKRLYGSSGNFQGEHSSPLSRGTFLVFWGCFILLYKNVLLSLGRKKNTTPRSRADKHLLL